MQTTRASSEPSTGGPDSASRGGAAGELAVWVNHNWLRLVLAAWLGFMAWSLFDRWNAIHWLSLGDTDDNMRLMQVRALLDGQGWYDLRQYRLAPPQGFDIHWSRIVDLPIAALILLLRPFTGTDVAERLATGIAPMLPLGLAMVSLSVTVRRLVAPVAWPLAIIFLFGATATMLMFAPLRIDHHGWQLAMLSVAVAGLCDPQRGRGGALVGFASAVSLSIGLELLPYAVMSGAIITLRWVIDRGDVERLSAYAWTLGGGTAAGYMLFASNANQVARCDALTPVWLTVMVAAGGLLFLSARINPASPRARLLLAAVAGVAVAAGFALMFPQCLGRPEQVSDELARTWLNNVREAKPVYAHPLRLALPISALPVIGTLGAMLAAWRARGTPGLTGWLAVMLFSLFAALMLLWQARAGPAAQMLAIPGAVALAWIVLPWCLGHRNMAVRVFGTVSAFISVSGLFAGLAVKYLGVDPPSNRTRAVNKATGQCLTIPAMKPLDRYPAQTVFTFVDLGPRLITLTHHSAVAGPYHRNGDAILDVQHAFSRSPENFRATAKRRGATLLLVCPNMAESTVYRARNPGGFYDRLAKGEKFDWLKPLPLPEKSPFRLYRIE